VSPKSGHDALCRDHGDLTLIFSSIARSLASRPARFQKNPNCDINKKVIAKASSPVGAHFCRDRRRGWHPAICTGRCSQIDLFGNGQGIVDFYSEMPHCAFQPIACGQ
jgi:hypothetical protein